MMPDASANVTADRRQSQRLLDNLGKKERQDIVDAFVHRHFTWPGTLRLHGAALGWDILRAPVNVVLSPFFHMARIAAWICFRLRMTQVPGWLLDRRLVLRTAVSAKVEAAILNELLHASLTAGPAIPERAEMSRAILSAPRFREMIRSRGTARAANPMPQGAQGGFLAGAGQTAMGVAGGMLLATAIGGMFAGPVEASEVLPEDEPDLGDAGFADDSDW